MKEFVKNVIGGHGILPPDGCRKTFDTHFEDAVHVDWFLKNKGYEAVFYINNIEYIAIFNASGNLLEYRMFLPVDFLPERVKKTIEVKGEIMNVVLINKRTKILYEVIIRNNASERYQIIVTDLGMIISEKLL